MLLHHIILLALIQGITEFLPISSSAHLILPSQLLHWPDQGLAFDLAVHLGTLIAVLIYLHQDILSMTTSCFVAFKEKKMDSQARLAGFVVLATLPAVLVGFFVKDWVAAELRSILVIALASIGFGLLLAWVDIRVRHFQTARTLENLSAFHALLIGCAQVLAFIPGTSRSGITITAGLALGFSRKETLRFSFLLSIPLILAGSLLSGLDLYLEGVSQDVWKELALGILLAGLSAFACIHLFMVWVDKIGMLPFVIYRVILGLVLLLVYWQTGV